jgi:hypothetical protein
MPQRSRCTLEPYRTQYHARPRGDLFACAVVYQPQSQAKGKVPSHVDVFGRHNVRVSEPALFVILMKTVLLQ